jgi:hypothetical protein
VGFGTISEEEELAPADRTGERGGYRWARPRVLDSRAPTGFGPGRGAPASSGFACLIRAAVQKLRACRRSARERSTFVLDAADALPTLDTSTASSPRKNREFRLEATALGNLSERPAGAGLATRWSLPSISIGAPRLRSIGIELPSVIASPEHRLYLLLAREKGDAAHSAYNALIRRLVSFERAAACAN